MPTLADHATTLADKHGLTKADAKSFAADLFAVILDAAKRGEDTSMPGFGKSWNQCGPKRLILCEYV